MANVSRKGERAGVRQDRQRRRRPRACQPLVPPFEATGRRTRHAAGRCTPAASTKLVALYEHNVFTQGAIWNINRFDQWGVESVRCSPNRIIPPARWREPRAGHDSSTNALIHRGALSAAASDCRRGGRIAMAHAAPARGPKTCRGRGSTCSRSTSASRRRRRRAQPDALSPQSLLRHAAARGTGCTRWTPSPADSDAAARHYARTSPITPARRRRSTSCTWSRPRRAHGPARPRRRGASRDRTPRSRSPRLSRASAHDDDLPGAEPGPRRCSGSPPVPRSARCALLAHEHVHPGRPRRCGRAAAGAGRRGGGGLSSPPGTPSTASIAAARSSRRAADRPEDRALDGVATPMASLAREHRQRPAHVSRSEDAARQRAEQVAALGERLVGVDVQRRAAKAVVVGFCASKGCSRRSGRGGCSARASGRASSGSVASVAQLTMSARPRRRRRGRRGVGGQSAARQSAARARPVGATRPHRHTPRSHALRDTPGQQPRDAAGADDEQMARIPRRARRRGEAPTRPPCAAR